MHNHQLFIIIATTLLIFVIGGLLIYNMLIKDPSPSPPSEITVAVDVTESEVSYVIPEISIEEKEPDTEAESTKTFVDDTEEEEPKDQTLIANDDNIHLDVCDNEISIKNSHPSASADEVIYDTKEG